MVQPFVMRVMYLNVSGEIGGAERSLLDILSSIRQAEPSWELRLADLNTPPPHRLRLAVG